MKKLLISLALLIGATGAYAADQLYSGHTPSSVQSATDTNSKTFYLYNLGTGQMLDKGGLWGTQPALGAGIPMTLETGSTNGTYAINTNTGTGKHLSFIDGSSINDSQDYKQWYIDQGKSAGAARDFKFTAAATDTYSNVYTLSITSSNSTYGGTYYLVANGSTIEASTTAPTDENGYWILVTHQDLLDNFKKAAEGAAGASAVNATFNIKDYDFARDNGDVSYWKKANGVDMQNHDKLTGSNSNYITPADATKTTTTTKKTTWSYTCTYYTWWGYSTSTHTGIIESNSKPTSCGSHSGRSEVSSFTATKLTDGSTTTTTTVTYPYYVGNGYGSNYGLSATSTSGKYYGNENEVVTGTSNHAQRYYGADWTGNIHGSSGKLYQTMSITLAAGKYTIECEGFSTDGSGKLFAQVGDATTVGDQYQEIAFIKPTTTPNTYVSAAKLINGDEYYKKSVTIIVPEPASGSLNTTITVGVVVENGTDDAWSCFDNFTIHYHGKDANVIILDEDKTDYSYINDQVETEKASTIYLNRAMKTGQWNSIVLPVSLTTDQVKEAFGADAKVSVLARSEKDGKQIIFEPVSLSGSKTAMEKGKVYIIKPTKAITEGKTKTSTKVSDLSIDKYYEISLVTFKEGVASGSVVPTNVVGSTEDNGLKHCGSYVMIDKTNAENEYAIPASTYILSNGKWYYNTVGVNKVKGFRGWIATNQSTTDAGKTNFVINGVSDDVTAIEGITAEPTVLNRTIDGVYTLGGQKVRDGQDLTGLAKGIYIVGGKKQVVK